MTATFDEFVNSLITNGERSGWTSQNLISGAYGKFQIMPTNWRNWSKLALANVSHPIIWAQLLAGKVPVADRSIPGENWWPTPTERIQTHVARWRLRQIWDKHNGNAQQTAAIWEGGGVSADISTWTTRQIKYANRICVPLGYDPLPLTGVI